MSSKIGPVISFLFLRVRAPAGRCGLLVQSFVALGTPCLCQNQSPISSKCPTLLGVLGVCLVGCSRFQIPSLQPQAIFGSPYWLGFATFVVFCSSNWTSPLAFSHSLSFSMRTTWFWEISYQLQCAWLGTSVARKYPRSGLSLRKLKQSVGKIWCLQTPFGFRVDGYGSDG